MENYRLPKTETARQDLAATIGADGQQLLSAVDAAAQQPELAQLPAVHVLRQVWAAQYVAEDGRMRLGDASELPRSAEQICSPYDPDARYSNKRDVTWVGYKVQVTETCDPACEGPHVITNVETTPATTPDDNMVAVIHNSLEKRGLLPGEHLVDKGYTDSHVLVGSRQRYGVAIVGPVSDDPSWQARLDDGLTKAAFHVDWDRKVVTCPAGKQNISWLPSTHTESGMIFEARFATRDCFPCPLRPRCTRGKHEPRIVGMQARALRGAARHTQAPENRGVPGTLRCPCWDRGHACPGHQPLWPTSVPLHRSRENTLAACSHSRPVNLVRVAEWCAGTPVAKTRRSRFATLQRAA